ncbi:unnamed protein product [Mytilus coruscus]|uniref:Uncharacterized protein n=1 Tax=Mytilus coruscus TaxID=42192 RepID=A0A6J8API6_MYTCO|nr:unnamed protein product [Mytilus coruscus]
MANLKQKVVLVTGASSGIGEATAIKLAEHGARLFLVALEEDKLQIADIAGYVMFSNVSETKEEDYDRFVNVNQKAKFFLAQLCLRYIKETKGNIIFMSSIRSTIPEPKVVVHCMAKIAIDMLTKCLAKVCRQVSKRSTPKNGRKTSRCCFPLALLGVR